jgi:hypothetical protein
MRNMVRAVRPTILALSFLLAVAVSPGAAQFPPQGATADPDHPNIATLTIDTTTTLSGLTVVTISYYYDCSKKAWVVTRVDATNPLNQPGGPSAIPIKVGDTAPPGPPPGSKREPGDPNHAFNSTTGQNFVFNKGKWIDTKTGKEVAEPKLNCPVPTNETQPSKPAPTTPSSPNRNIEHESN